MAELFWLGISLLLLAIGAFVASEKPGKTQRGHSKASHLAGNARIAELEREQERGFAMLEMHGVPRQRAKHVSNGIDVLMTRMGKADRIHAMTTQALNDLCAAIREKAKQWLVPGNGFGIEQRKICAAELLAMVGEAE